MINDRLVTVEELAAQNRTKRAVKLLDELGLAPNKRIDGQQLKAVLKHMTIAEHFGAGGERSWLIMQARNAMRILTVKPQTPETEVQELIRAGVVEFLTSMCEELERAPIWLDFSDEKAA